MRFYIYSFDLDRSDYMYIFFKIAKHYLFLYVMAIPFLLYLTNMNIKILVLASIIFVTGMLIKLGLVITNLKKLISSYYVEVKDKGIFIYNSDDSNYYIEYNDIKFVFLSKDGNKASIITKKDTYSTISTLLNSYDKLIDMLKDKGVQFRHDVYDGYKDVLSEYKEM